MGNERGTSRKHCLGKLRERSIVEASSQKLQLIDIFTIINTV